MKSPRWPWSVWRSYGSSPGDKPRAGHSSVIGIVELLRTPPHLNLDQFDEAIRLDPQDAITYSKRGSAYSNLDQAERAIQDYDEAIRLDPQYAIAYSNRAFAYRNLGQYELAKRDNAKAKELGYEP